MTGEECTYVRRKIVSKWNFVIRINEYVTIHEVSITVRTGRFMHWYGFTGVFTLRVRP